MARPPVVIIGVGNQMRRDDGVGPAVVDELRRTGIDGSDGDVELITLDGESTRLLEAWAGRRRAVLVDAARSGAPPGTVHRIELGHDPLPDTSFPASSHGQGLLEAVELGRALGRLPNELVILAVEAGDVSMGSDLTPAVGAALPTVVARAAAEARG